MAGKAVTPEVLPDTSVITSQACLQLRMRGWTLQRIGDHFGITFQSVAGRLQRIAGWLESSEFQVEVFKKNRADLLALVQQRAIAQITDQKLEDSSAAQLAVLSGIMYDKERLERGQATEIVDTRALTCDIVELDRRIAEKEAALKGGQ